jgi:hypothetical protein
MGNIPSHTNAFVAGTKARSQEVNTNFTETISFLTDASYDHWANGFINARRMVSNRTITGNQCFMAGYYQIDTGSTLHLGTSTARGVIFQQLDILSNGALRVNSGAALRII